MNNPPRTIEEYMTDERYSQMVADAHNKYGDEGFENFFFCTGEFALYLLSQGKVKHNGEKLIKVSTGREVKLWNPNRRDFN